MLMLAIGPMEQCMLELFEYMRACNLTHVLQNPQDMFNRLVWGIFKGLNDSIFIKSFCDSASTNGRLPLLDFPQVEPYWPLNERI